MLLTHLKTATPTRFPEPGLPRRRLVMFLEGHATCFAPEVSPQGLDLASGLIGQVGALGRLNEPLLEMA